MTPSVSILLPVLDEFDHIDACLDSLLGQAYAGDIEILVADGGSTDGTADRLARRAAERSISVHSNPARRQAPGLDLLLAHATGEICIRADAHTTYAPDYVAANVEAVLGGATLAGGPMRVVGVTGTERAIAVAMMSPLAAGPAPFRSPERAGPADTVYLGAIRTSDLRAHGGYRLLPSGVAEDADLAARISESGGSVVLDPRIRSQYRPRSSMTGLARQYHRYGRGKAEMLYLHRRLPSWRPIPPVALIVGLVGTAVVGLTTGPWWPLIALGGAWLAVIAALIPRGGPLAALAAGVMHLSYGIGFIRGLVTGWRAHAAVRGASPPPGA